MAQLDGGCLSRDIELPAGQFIGACIEAQDMAKGHDAHPLANPEGLFLALASSPAVAVSPWKYTPRLKRQLRHPCPSELNVDLVEPTLMCPGLCL
eukprot:5373480-Prymnesium_polylepis.2